MLTSLTGLSSSSSPLKSHQAQPRSRLKHAETGLVNEAFKMTRNQKRINILFVMLVALLMSIIYYYRSTSPERIAFGPAALIFSISLIFVAVRVLWKH